MYEWMKMKDENGNCSVSKNVKDNVKEEEENREE